MKSDTQLLKGTVRLLILRLLGREPMYGYQMIQHLKDRSEGYFQLGEGALYPLLHEMEGQAFLRAKWQDQDGRPKRRYYHLTAKGKKELALRLETWQGFTKAVDLVLEASHV
ncbi:MAG: helix-turn-helix transcriptional regulator [Proteobacteria bacterium]|nr:helix-turn-helix transcriptional regulator [Pseudomonadota bacterium]